MLTTIHTNEVQNIDNVFHFAQVKWHPFIWIFASFSGVPSCTLVSVFDNLLKHVFINKVSKRINFILDGFGSTNWSSLVCLRLHARALDGGGHVANHTRPFFPANELLAVRWSLSCSEESSLSLSSPLPTVNSSSALVVWFLTVAEASSHFSGDDWPSTESSLSMISSSLELSSKSDQLVPLSQWLLLQSLQSLLLQAFLQSLFRFFWDLIPICNQLFDVAFFLLKLIIFCHKSFYFALHSMKNAMINYFLYCLI